ncbi:MAG: TetR family transcriptional regulator [Solirubrobacteraceae bacterium]
MMKIDMAAPDGSSKEGSRRPKGDPGVTRERIERAARASFAERGWAGTSLRGIARDVGVDAALVHYYFSSKEALLDAVTTPPPEWLESIRRTNSAPPRGRGEAVARNLVWTWSQPEIRDVLSSILQTAAHEARTREKLRQLVTLSLLPAIAAKLDDDERLVRASMISSQLVGVAMLRYILHVEPLASLPDEDLVALLAPTIQRYLTDPLS